LYHHWQQWHIDDEFTHFDNDRENVMEMDTGTDPSCEKRPLRSSRINNPLVPSLTRRGYSGGQGQIFKSLGILGKLVRTDDTLACRNATYRVGKTNAALRRAPTVSGSFGQARILTDYLMCIRSLVKVFPINSVFLSK